MKKEKQLKDRFRVDPNKAALVVIDVQEKLVPAMDRSLFHQVRGNIDLLVKGCSELDVPVIEGSGDGYVADLTMALEQVERPVLTLGADLPLLDGAAIDWVMDAYDTGSAMVAVPVERKTELGVSIDSTSEYQGTTVAPTGVNVVGDPEPEDTLMTTDPEFAVNVNRPRDAWIATVFAGGDGPR